MSTREPNRQKVAIVTGSSSGIGYATSLILARNGFYTYASARNISKSTSLQYTVDAERLPLKLIQLDVTDDSSIKGAVEKIVSEKGIIDVLVNNAGYGLFGAFEDLSVNEIKAQFETNFFGVVRVAQHVLPIMRNGIGMAYELEPFGIKVILIEPGAIGSGFMKGSVMSNRALDPKSPYFEFVRKVRSKISSDHENATQPDEVAKTIVQAILSEKPEFRYVVGSDAVTLMQARKNMPYSDFQHMIQKIVQ